MLAKIQREGRVLVSELSEALGTSRITIRKDLDYLESKGLLHRTHGGALALNGSALLDPSLQEKEKEKQKIAVATAVAGRRRTVKVIAESQVQGQPRLNLPVVLYRIRASSKDLIARPHVGVELPFASAWSARRECKRESPIKPVCKACRRQDRNKNL